MLALEGLIEGRGTDADEGLEGIGSYTGAPRLTDAKTRSRARGRCEGKDLHDLRRHWMAVDRPIMVRSDGMSRIRCGICAGSGKSNYRDDPKFVQGQKRRRALGKRREMSKTETPDIVEPVADCD